MDERRSANCNQMVDMRCGQMRFTRKKGLVQLGIRGARHIKKHLEYWLWSIRNNQRTCFLNGNFSRSIISVVHSLSSSEIMRDWSFSSALSRWSHGPERLFKSAARLSTDCSKALLGCRHATAKWTTTTTQKKRTNKKQKRKEQKKEKTENGTYQKRAKRTFDTALSRLPHQTACNNAPFNRRCFFSLCGRPSVVRDHQ